MADDVVIRISAQNLTGPAFAEAQKALAKLGLDMKGVDDSSRKSSGGVGLLSSTMGSLSGVAKTAIGTMGGFIGAQVVLGGLKSAFSFAADAAIGMNANLEKSTLQFTTLMGDSQRAEAHVRSLFEFAKRTPFETEPIITASRHMQTFGGDTLNTMENLELLGDASAATGAPIEDLGFWVGRMYASLQGGQPIGEATMRLMELGVLTPQTRVQMEALAESAGGGEKAFDLFKESIGKFGGAMVAQANTWEGLTSSISDAVKITLAQALEPFFETIKTGAQVVLQALGSEGTQRVFDNLRVSLTDLFGGNGQDLVKSFAGGLLDAASFAVTGADLIHRAWSGLKLVFYGTASVVELVALAFVTAVEKVVQVGAKLPGVGDSFKGLAHELSLTKAAMETAQKSFHEGADAALEGVKGNSEFARVSEIARTTIAGMKDEIQKATVSTDTHTAAVARGTGAQGGMVVQTKEQKKALEEAEKAATKFRDSIQYFNRADNLGGLLPSLRSAEEELRAMGGSLHDLPADIDLAVRSWEPLKPALTDSKKLIQSLKTETTSWGQTVTSVIGKIPGLVQSAFTGGGGLGGAMQAITSAFGEAGMGKLFAEGGTLSKTLSGGFSKVFGSTIGGALSAAIPGIGAALGSLIGPLAGKLGGLFKGLFGGISPEVKAARQEIEGFQQSLASTLTATQRAEAGGEKWKMTVIAVRDAYLATGRSAAEAEAVVKQLWDTDHPDRAKAAMEQINAVLGEQKEILEGAKSEAADLWGELLDAAGDASVQIPEDIKLMVDRMAELGAITQEQADNFRNLTDGTLVNVKAMETAATDLGLDFSALGPAYQQAKLDEKFAALFRSIKTVEVGTKDFGLATFSAKEEIQALVDESLNYKTTIPDNMRPYIEALIEGGNLTDANGQKLTDIGQLNFAEPVVDKLTSIADRLTTVLEKLAGVDTKMGSDMPNAAATAGDAMVDNFNRGGAAADDLADKIRGVIEMQSPTGLEGIAHYSMLAGDELEMLSIRGGSAMTILKARFDDAAGTIERKMGGTLDGLIAKLQAFNSGVPVGTFGDYTPEAQSAIEVLKQQIAEKKASLSGTKGDERTAIENEIKALEAKLAAAQGNKNPYEGYADPNIELVSEAEAIARAREIAALYGEKISDAGIGELARKYGYGGSGQLSKARLEAFLKDFSKELIAKRYQGYAGGTFGVHGVDFPDYGSGTPVVLHRKEAVTPESEKIPTALRWLRQEGYLQGGGGGPAINVYVAVDPTTGRGRQVTESQFREIQQGLYDGRLSVPAAAITARGR